MLCSLLALAVALVKGVVPGCAVASVLISRKAVTILTDGVLLGVRTVMMIRENLG